DEVGELSGQIKEFLSILASHERLYAIMREEFVQVKNDFATPRKTTIEEGEFDQDMEDLIPREDMVITVTNTGYIKRVPVNTYRAQNRGGKGRSGMSTREEDAVAKLFVACTHDPILFFSSKGMVYKMKAYRLPEGTPQSLGKALINLLPLEQGETISTVLRLPEKQEDCEGLSVMFATASGNIRRNRLDDFYKVMSNGKIAMKLDEGDKLVDVQICNENQDILLAAAGGKCVRCPVTDVRIFESRSSTGVRGMKLAKGDRVISMSVLEHVKAEIDKRDAYLKMAIAKRKALGAVDDGEDTIETEGTSDVILSDEEFAQMEAEEQFILTVTTAGLGKRSSAYQYRITSRGTQGVTNIDTIKVPAEVVASMPVTEDEHVMMVTDGGQLIRMRVRDIRIVGRNSKGVILFRLADGEKVVSVSAVKDYGEEDENSADEVTTEQEGVVNTQQEQLVEKEETNEENN
ncbi:MAG: DNA gyrase subunit A, partial [Alphaproteobacteria bacterium]|nr:DNA gyrase subunit A [Alphaproteobacteria bacterium]